MTCSARLFSALVLLAGIRAQAATEATPGALLVSIRPEVQLRLQGRDRVSLRIRLAPQAQANLWRSDNCESSVGTPYVIVVSGDYSVPLASIAGEGSLICLRSTDGTLSAVVAR